MSQKIVICGAGFLGSNIAKTILNSSSTTGVTRCVQVSSRKPETIHRTLQATLKPGSEDRLLPPVAADVTKPNTLLPAFKDATAVVSLVGLLHGSPADFDRIQWHGAENVAKAAQAVGAKLIHISAIGADPTSQIPYARTKALGEKAVFEACPSATVIRPSIIFGPGDGFFGRFATLSRILPFMPVFGGGTSRFQPVFVGDVARAVEIISRDDVTIRQSIDGKTMEAGGPDVLTYREVIELVLKYTGRRRPIISLPFWVGKSQGMILERLPTNLLTITRDQVEQLKLDNVVNPTLASNHVSFKEFVQTHSGETLKTVHEVLPTYL